MTNRDRILAYYDAFRTRDRAALEKLLAPDMIHRSPFGEYRNRDAMLDAIWPAVGRTWAVKMEVYGEGPAHMVRYRHNVPDSPTVAEYVRFDGDLIAEIEVYMNRLPGR